MVVDGMMLLSRSRSRGASGRCWRRIGCDCCHAEAEHRREQKNNFVHDFDKQVLRFSHVCFFLRSLEKSGLAPNQPIRVTCGRQKPRFGRADCVEVVRVPSDYFTRRCRSNSQSLSHTLLHTTKPKKLTEVSKINSKESILRSSRSPRRLYEGSWGARSQNKESGDTTSRSP
jgi:hypothetical protein